MFIAYSLVDICKADKGWIPNLSPTYYGDNKWGYLKWCLKRKENKIKKALIKKYVLFSNALSCNNALCGVQMCIKLQLI